MRTLSQVVKILIKIDGQLLKSNSIALSSIAIRSHIAYYLPTLEMSLIDYNNELAQYGITSGTKIEVLLSQKNNNINFIPFIVFSATPTMTGTTGNNYVISGYYDFYNYLYKRTTKSFNLSSSEIFTNIMSESKLTSVIDTSTDKKSWNCNSKTYAEFLKKDILPYAYNGDDSYYTTGISAITQKAYFKDLTKVATQEKTDYKLINTILTGNEKYDGIISEYNYRNRAGFMAKVAQGLKSYTYDLLTATNIISSETKVAKTNNNIGIDKNLLTDAQKIFQPLEVGNKSEKEYKTQNRYVRNSSLYSNEIDVLVRHYTEIDLLNFVQIDIFQNYNNPIKEERMSGRYICAGKAIVATETEYVEKLCFIRNGENLPTNKDML